MVDHHLIPFCFFAVVYCIAICTANQLHSAPDPSYIAHSHVFKEEMAQLSSRNDLVNNGRLAEHHVHEVIFAMQLRNTKEVTRILHDVSNPASKNYGHHLTREELYELTYSPEACAALTEYLNTNGASVVSETSGGEYITATAPVAIWEKVFKTEFFKFHQTHLNGDTHEVVRAKHYSLPRELNHHIVAVMNVIDMPVISKGTLERVGTMPIMNEKRRRLSLAGAYRDYGWITPAKLRIRYNMAENQGNDLSTQAVYSTGKQYFSPPDLAYFQENISMQPLQPAISIGGHDVMNSSLYDCIEGNLDLQYIMAMSPGSPTTHWYHIYGISSWIRDLGDIGVVPLVLSISYGQYEQSTSEGEINFFQLKVVRLGVMGVTVVVAAGDSGAARTGYDASSLCRYEPMYPSGSMYVVSVGGTVVRTLLTA